MSLNRCLNAFTQKTNVGEDISLHSLTRNVTQCECTLASLVSALKTSA